MKYYQIQFSISPQDLTFAILKPNTSSRMIRFQKNLVENKSCLIRFKVDYYFKAFYIMYSEINVLFYIHSPDF